MNARLIVAAAIVLLAAGLAVPRAAEARTENGLTTWFTDVYVAPSDDINGDLNVVFGNATIAGHVRGNVNTVFGACTSMPAARIDGEEHCFPLDGARAVVPWLIPHPFASPAATELFQKLASSAVVLVVFLLFPLRMRVALDRVERHPALCALAGAVAAVAMIPLGFILIVSLIGIPLVLLEVAALFAGVWIGTGAIALLVGRRLCEVGMPATTPPPFVALVIGLVVVSAAEIAPFIGWAVTALVWLVGLGSALLSFIRSMQIDGAVRRAPIGGPPMPTSRY